uniref:Uncharacterized protein n=1 Tax=Paramormyrops kingsleyae TaxID=1676925 RepID=A0A3B3QY27_9TELE
MLNFWEFLSYLMSFRCNEIISLERRFYILDVMPKDVCILSSVLEHRIVLDNLKDIPNAFIILIGLLYALNINYTFEILQKVIYNIGAERCSSKVHGLRNKLLQYSEIGKDYFTASVNCFF